jgi:cytochrome c biogenesis protein
MPTHNGRWLALNPSKPKQPKGLFRRVNDFLSSVKLSIFVLIALALTSIFGTVIQQGEPQPVYVDAYGEAVARVIGWLNLGDMYHSWWFQILLALLLTNITFCSIRRLPHAIQLMTDREPVFDGRPVAIHEKWEQKLHGTSMEEASRRIEQVLRGKFRRLARKEVDGKVYFFGSKGAWSRMGVYVTHSSLFLFVVGALIGLQWGFKGSVVIPEGQSVSQVRLRSNLPHDLGFQVRCDDFAMEFYPDGRVKDYLSDLTVTENGVEVSKRRIEVNAPLIHRGIYFYQSFYGGTGVKLSVYGPRNNLVAHDRYLRQRGQIDLGGGQWLGVRDFPNIQGRPAAQVVLGEERRVLGNAILFPGRPARLGNYLVQANQLQLFTGLQVAKDPGVPVIWAGCVLITVGCLVAFFASHRRVWARVHGEGNTVAVFLGGSGRVPGRKRESQSPFLRALVRGLVRGCARNL